MIKKIMRKIIYPNTYNSEVFKKYLIKKGCLIGKNTFFYSPRTTTIDVQNACFIKIGDNCKITQGVTILAHDFSYSVLRPIYHEIPKKAAITEIGNNVFLGMHSIILMGSKIGNNVIIGAGSVVSGRIPDNEVWAGNPARFICNIEEYYEKCKSKFEDSAKLTVRQYNERYGRNPTIQELQYFATLFLNNQDYALENYKNMSFQGDDSNLVIEDCLRYKSKYKNYDEFIEEAKNE